MAQPTFTNQHFQLSNKVKSNVPPEPEPEISQPKFRDFFVGY